MLLLFTGSSLLGRAASAGTHTHHAYGPPAGAPASNESALGDGYTVSWSRSLESPTWISYRADPASHSQLKSIQESTALLCNLPNRAPQLYRGPWQAMQQQIRRFTATQTLFVTSGVIAGGYWQVILYPDTAAGALRTAAFLFPANTRVDSPLLDHLTTIDTLERLTGLDLFPNLVNALEITLEADNHRAWASQIFASLPAAPRLPESFKSLLDRPELPALKDLETMGDIPSDSGLSNNSSCTPAADCCKICGKGIACGNTCIAANKTCHVGRGCACDSWEVCDR